MSNKTYDLLKDISLLWMPVLITFYGTVAKTTGIPYTDVVLTILVAMNTALGAIVKYYSVKYNKPTTTEGE